jgi:hypothetical protein
MGKELHELRDMLMDELSSITGKGELTAGSLDTVDKLTHSIKSIDTICAMEDAGGYSYDGMSYADRRMSYADRNRDSRGRYSRTGNRYSRRGYSMMNKSDLVDELRELMNDASDSRSKTAIQNAIREMED